METYEKEKKWQVVLEVEMLGEKLFIELVSRLFLIKTSSELKKIKPVAI